MRGVGKGTRGVRLFVSALRVVLLLGLLSNVGEAQPYRDSVYVASCDRAVAAGVVRRTGSVPAADVDSACKAVRLAISVMRDEYKGRIDSTLVVRHDPVNLNNGKIEPLYYLVFYRHGRGQVEVAVERVGWKAIFNGVYGPRS